MGYTTDFTGQFDLDKPLSAAQVAYLKKFNETRRMKRDVNITKDRPDPVRNAVKLPLGTEGEYFVGAEGFMGQEHDAPDVLDGNCPPSTQPSLWCQWTATDDGTAIVWDEGEKFYDYVEWLEYIIENFLKPWKRKITGRVHWQGEDSNDRGIIFVKDNVVRTAEDSLSNPLDDEDDPDEARVKEEIAELNSAHPPAIVVRTVKSKSKPKSKPHEVRISRTDGKLYCTCKGWQMRKSCRHTQDTTKEHILAALEQAGAEGGLGI